MATAMPGIRIGGTTLPTTRRPPTGGVVRGGVFVGAPLKPAVDRTPPAPAAATTSTTGGGGGSSSATGTVPPPVSHLDITGSAPAELTRYASQYESLLNDIRNNHTRQADSFREGVDSDIERQVATAREQAASEGRPFDEAKMRSELSRGRNKATADFELGSQAQEVAARQGGLGIMSAPFSAEQAARALSLDTQRTLLNYDLGRAGAANEAARTEIARSSQAMQGYQAMLSLLASLAS